MKDGMKRIVGAIVAILAGLPTIAGPGRCTAEEAKVFEFKETPEQKDMRMAWWREARFGMFIHWGLYAVPAGTWKGKQIGGIGEWISSMRTNGSNWPRMPA